MDAPTGVGCLVLCNFFGGLESEKKYLRILPEAKVQAAWRIIGKLPLVDPALTPSN